MKIGFMCDTHMPNDKMSPQYAFFKRAMEQMRADGIETMVHLGDITSYGETEALAYYLEETKDMEQYFVLGNSDVRDKKTVEHFFQKATDVTLQVCGRTLLGIHTPYAEITEHDREKIATLQDGDVLFLHHGMHRLKEESRAYLEEAVKDKSLTIIHAHSHMRFDFMVGNTHVIGLRALDPDKTIGDYPCVTYFDITKDAISMEEKLFDIPLETLMEVREHFGISCVDNHRDVTYALENNVKGVELRCNGGGWEPDMTLLPLIKEWREKTNGYLSVHMPNIRWKDGELIGKETWYQAVDYAKAVGVNGLTIHPPRVKKVDMPVGGEVWKMFLDLYTYVAKNMNDDVKIGIENLHMEPYETDDEERGFGCNPQEVSMWIDAINEDLGKPNRVGHLLDVGHARNNGSISQQFPISKWYRIMGNKAVAYHIHQVVPMDNKLTNHRAIEDWLGPVICYASYFYAWRENILNHAPIFLEVRGCENYEKSIQAFERTFGVK